MAKWIAFNRDWDFKHPSRAVTAYKADSIVYVPNHIAEKAISDNAAEETEKPEGEDGRSWLNG